MTAVRIKELVDTLQKFSRVWGNARVVTTEGRDIDIHHGIGIILSPGRQPQLFIRPPCRRRKAVK